MAARSISFLLIINLQIFLSTARGITLPLNTETVKIESFIAQPEYAQSPELEDIPQTTNELVSSESKDVIPNLIVPTSPMLMIPKIQNSFNIVLALAKECALKYGHYNKIQSKNHESSWDLPQQFTKSMSESMSVEDSTKPSSSELSLPLKVFSSVAPESLDPCYINSNDPLDINKTSASISSCFDSSDTLITKPNTGFSLPLSLSCSLKPMETSQKSHDLASQLYLSNTELPQESSVPVCSLFAVSESPNTRITDTPLAKPRSTYTLPLSITSTTCSIKPQLASNLPSSASLDNTLTPTDSSTSQSSLHIYNKTFTTPLSLPNLLTLSVLDQGPSSVDVLAPNPFVTDSVTAANSYLSPLMVTTEAESHVLPSKCPLVSASTNSYQDTSPTNISPVNLDKNLVSSSPCRHTNFLQSLPTGYLATLTSLCTLPSPNVLSQSISDSSCPQSELISLNTLPRISQSPLVRNTLLENYHKTSLDLSPDNAYASAIASSGLASTPISPSSSNALFLTSTSSSSDSGSNFLFKTPSTPYSVLPNTFLYSSDISCSPAFDTENKSYKRSFETSDKDKGIQNIDSAQCSFPVDIKNITRASSIPNTVSDKLSSRESNQKLLELISFAEILNDHGIPVWNLLNEIVLMLKNELYHIQYSA